MPRRLREQRRRGETTELHRAALCGSTERTTALLASGMGDIDEVDLTTGFSPLLFAAGAGHARVVKILLDNGADPSVVGRGGCTALHLSAQEGHVAATTMLINAGADLEAVDDVGYTPLHLAVRDWGMTRALVQRGADVDRRSAKDGNTALHMCASAGHAGATRELLRAKANALLTTPPSAGRPVVPLELAAACGHADVVRELVQQVGIKGCGGASRGEAALQIAAQDQRMDMLATLTEAGAVDTGAALSTAACYGREAPARLLLQQQKARNPAGTAAYLQARDATGRTPMFCCIAFCPSPRMVRVLVDAGADTSAGVKITNPMGSGVFHNTPLAWTNLHLKVLKTVNGQPATEEQLGRLEAIYHLLLRVDAVRAVSWLWPGDAPFVTRAAAAAEGSRRVNNTSTPPTATPLTAMLPVLRERARRRGVLMTAQSRYSAKA